jgi:hypothetical protein
LTIIDSFSANMGGSRTMNNSSFILGGADTAKKEFTVDGDGSVTGLKYDIPFLPLWG